MHVRNILSCLELQANLWPEKPAFIYLKDGEVEAQRMSFAQLQQQSYALGSALAGTFERQARVIIALPDGIDFIRTFLGVLYAGLIPVPVKPALNNEARVKLIRIAEDCQPVAIFLAPGMAETPIPGLALQFLQSEALIASVATGQAVGVADCSSSGAQLAFLQYTSGSTGYPKGVMVSHDNLLANESMLSGTWEVGSDDVIVSWLPMFHDMGLMGSVLLTVYTGAQCVLMTPGAFVQRPARWLQAVERYGGTIMGGPNFAYKLLCTPRVSESLQGLDLSSLKVVYCGSEPVSVAVAQTFLQIYHASALRCDVFSPCYGLAEATLMVSGGRLGDGYSTMAVDVVTSLALPDFSDLTQPTPGIKLAVSCGASVSGQQLRIVNRDTRQPCAEYETGEVWVAGPHIALGYWNNPVATQETFGACLAGEPRGCYLRTGDLGFLAGDKLYISGRIKELIIVNGNNYYPQDIEETCSTSHMALGSRAAAFGISGQNGEEIVIVQELDKSITDDIDPEFLDDVTRSARSAIYREHSLTVREIIYVKNNSIPKTTSGKICRVSCRRGYESRSLDVFDVAVAQEFARVERI